MSSTHNMHQNVQTYIIYKREDNNKMEFEKAHYQCIEVLILSKL